MKYINVADSVSLSTRLCARKSQSFLLSQLECPVLVLVSNFDLNAQCCYFTRGADKFLARPGRKQRYGDQTRDLFNIIPMKLNKLHSPFL